MNEMSRSGTGTMQKPEIMAPAGSKASFLAAVAAGADAIYCGLKSYSARMAAKNFSIEQLAALTRLAHAHGTKVYVTLNSLLRTGELTHAGRLMDELQRYVKPDALIIQDLALIELAGQIGFTGGIYLSTLANVTDGAALKLIRNHVGIARVVLPRELNIDEVKAIARLCPNDLALEVFIHGALCYAVSGRCYWSSFLGGRSGLRGRCVQPCRRLFEQSRQPRRFFSCQDLSLDVLAKVLLSIPQVKGWKIEGRKKGPHYVYYTVKAYQILRDLDKNPEKRSIAKKTALSFLAQSLGRAGTHYNFLPQRPQIPINVVGQTGSGMFVGKIRGSRNHPYVICRMELLAGDVLRIGYEDETWHAVQRVGKYIPPKGRFHIKTSSKRIPAAGTPVFLTDRREKALADMLTDLDRELEKAKKIHAPPSKFDLQLPEYSPKKSKPVELYVHRRFNRSGKQVPGGLWLSDEALKTMPHRLISSIRWWLPPVGWPAEVKAFNQLLERAMGKGGHHFVLNTPWQIASFNDRKNMVLWAGPFCNVANSLAIKAIAGMGFAGAIVSPELEQSDFLALPKHSPLPLGIVISGSWPLCISRTISDDIKQNKPFTSPKGEQAWFAKYESNYWVFPNWKLDLTVKKDKLKRAGYQMFVHLLEPIPAAVKLKKRPGLWNWEVGLK